MKFTSRFVSLQEAFFSDRLIGEMNASPHTIASYSYTFQLLLKYAKLKLKKTSSQLTLDDLDYKFICNFLEYLAKNRKIKPQSLNIRLTAIRSFFHYIEPHMPEYSAFISKVLSIKEKRINGKLIDYLNDKEIEALLKAPNQHTWIGRRDHCLLALAIQTGLRLSEILSLKWEDVSWNECANVHCIGKGRKERYAILNKQSTKILQAWSKVVNTPPCDIIFPSRKGDRMSSDAFQYLVKKYAKVAAEKCPSLKIKKITPHVLRHTMAMKLLHNKVGLAGIALSLGHESLKTTYKYLNASVEQKESIMKLTSLPKTKTSRFHPTDITMIFLKNMTKFNENGGFV